MAKFSELKSGNSDNKSSLKEKLLKAFPAFRHRDYQLYFFGQFISLIGTWLQMVAQGYLVYDLTHSALWVGITFALNSIPVTLFVLFGGVIVDRFSKKKILIFTQIASLIFALILGFLTILDIVTVLQICVFSFLLGTVTAIDMPARQAFMNDIVDRKELSSSIALNAGMFNMARVVGPLIAGILIGLIGEGGAFIVNSLSFIAPMITLFFMKSHIHKAIPHIHPLKAIKEGISYSVKHEIIRDLMIFAGLNALFGWSYITILPVVNDEVFHKGAYELSYLYASAGIGSVLGTIIVSSLSHKIRPSQFILGGLILFAVSLFAFSLTTNLYLALVFLFFSGLGLVMHFSMMTSTIQHTSPPQILGRVMSVYTFMFMGLSPLGSLQVGFIAENLGSPMALRISAVIMLIWAVFNFIRNKKLKDIEHF